MEALIAIAIGVIMAGTFSVAVPLFAYKLIEWSDGNEP